MGDLFSSLSMAARSLEAQRFGLDVTGQNIANVNTPGYARRVLDFAAVPPTDASSAGGGVDVVGVRAARDMLLEGRMQQEVPFEQRERAVAEVLSIVEVALGRPGASIDAAMNGFFDAFANLSSNPNSAVTRQEVLLQGEAVAGAFRDMAGRISLSSRDTDAQVRGAIDEITQLASQIAKLNDSMGSTSAASGGSLHLQDEQSELVRRLAGLLDVDVLPREGGGVDVTFGNGRALVVGERAYPITTTQVAGVSRVMSGGFDVTAEISGGQLGGFLYARDVLLPAYAADLDTVAFELAEEVNALHAAGVGGDGGTGRNFFTPIAVTAGAAAALTVDATMAANSQLVAAAGPGAPVGDNAAARDIAALRNVRVVGGTATLADAWGQLVYRVARDSRAARDGQRSREEIVNQVDQLRDQVSGISLDEEAMHLMKFQRAYEANARFFRAIDQALDTLMQMAR
jgi:flagellar hook-associated protein 1 FlgK